MKKKGFTLIEIIVAIAILAIVAVPIAKAIINSAKTNRESTDLVKATQLCQKKMEDVKVAISSGSDPTTSPVLSGGETDLLGASPYAGTWIVKSLDGDYYVKCIVTKPAAATSDSNGSGTLSFNNPVNSEVSPVDISGSGPYSFTITGDASSAALNDSAGHQVGNASPSGTEISIYFKANNPTAETKVIFKNLNTSLATINAIVKDDSNGEVNFEIDPNSIGATGPSINRTDMSSLAKTAAKDYFVYDITVKVYKVKDVTNLSSIDSVNPLAASHSKRLVRR